MTDQIRDVLSEMGYHLIDHGKQFRTRPLYRDSDNNTVLTIEKSTGKWYDFKEGVGGSFEDLVKISLGLSSLDEAKKFLDGKISTHVKTKIRPEIKSVKTFPLEMLEKLEQDNSYWNDRGISDETLRLFQGGVARSGRMSDRYVFPIFNSKKQIVGFSGRDLTNSPKRPKWKHLGDKKEWRYPLQVNAKIIRKFKKVFLVESIGDMLSLWDANVQNTIVTFGLGVSTSIVNLLLIFDPDQIILSLNNDFGNNFAGNEAAEKAKRKLLKYFDSRQVKICLPSKNDFGDMSKEDIFEWLRKTK